MYRWRLPGPHEYIDDVVHALRNGFNVVSAVPLCCVAGIGDALTNCLSSEGWVVSGHFLDGESNPMDQLYEWLDIADRGQTRRSISTLLAGMDPASVVIVDGIHRRHWTEWKQFLAIYEAASRGVPRSDRPLLLAVVEGTPEADLGRNCAALKILPWNNVVGEFDMMLYILEQLRNRGKKSTKNRLLARIIARLSLWDFELASQLTTLDERLLFEPLDCFRLVSESLPMPDGLGASWEAGGMMLFDDVPLQHPYLLLADPSKHEFLRQRLWEALAGDLLPIIETKRHYWAQEMRAIIRPPVQLGDQVFNDIDELEIGQLAFLARQQNLRPQIRRGTETLRRYRNKLAHMEPLSYAEAFDSDLLIKA